jgi:tetratricopeptide (TPR) repeat protein
MTAAGLRSRWPRWPVTLALVAVVVAGGAAAVAKWPHAWWWLIVVMAAAAAVIPPVLETISQAIQRRREIARVARAGLQGTTGAGGGTLPPARTANLEARVHQTVLAIPYIHRDEEDAICAYLRSGRPVLLIGSSMVGKTRMAARVIAEAFGAWPVAIPDSKTALAELDAKDIALQHSVIWLDDIDRLIGAGGITDGALQRLAAAENVIIGTIRAGAYEPFRPSDQLRPPEWDVLSSFEHIFISRDLTEKEQERLAGAVDDPEILDRIRAVGLGEYVGAARQVAEALKLGAAGADGVGYALVLAAADWRRCGMSRPVQATMLSSLAEPHLDQRMRARLHDQDSFSAGLAWATRNINPNVALLQPSGPDSYVLYDYALDLISQQGIPVPTNTWTAIMTDADASELVDIGYTARVIFHRTETAIQAWRSAASSGQDDVAPTAAYNLGVLLTEQGDADGGKAAYQQAIDSGEEYWAPAAWDRMGELLQEQGDVAGARAAYQQAIDSGEETWAPAAAVDLGELLREQGDVAGARAAYRQAIDSGEEYWAPAAWDRMGELLREQGDVAGARAAYQQAIDSGHETWAPAAAVDLGDLLREQGDVAGARAAYQQAIDSGEEYWAPVAVTRLREMLKDIGS